MIGSPGALLQVVFNVERILREHVRGGPCRAHRESIQLKVEAAGVYSYPDVFVTCDPADHADPRTMRNAVLVVEVRSESTADYDHGRKFADYRKLENLVDYLLVDSRARRVELLTRLDDGTWRLRPIEGGGPLELTSIGLTLRIEDFYVDTTVTADA